MPQLSLTGHELNLNAKCLLWRFIYLHREVIKPPTSWYLLMHHSHRLINIFCQTFLLPPRTWCLRWAKTEKSDPVSWTSLLFLLYFLCVCLSLSLPASSRIPFSRSPPGVHCHTRPARRWRSDVASCWIPSPNCQSLRVSAAFHLSPPPFQSHSLSAISSRHLQCWHSSLSAARNLHPRNRIGEISFFFLDKHLKGISTSVFVSDLESRALNSRVESLVRKLAGLESSL